MEVKLNSNDIDRTPHNPVSKSKDGVEILKAALIKKGVISEAEVTAEANK